MDKGVVLVVDDEELVRKTLVREIKEGPYEVVTGQDARSALQVLKAREVDVVITDLNMPGVRGLSLLAIIRDHFPEVVRIVLTGYADQDALLAASNEVGAFRFYTKPWSRRELMEGLKDAMRQRRLLVSYRNLLRKLDEGLREIKSLDQDFYKKNSAAD